MTPPLHDAHCHVVEPTLAAAGLVSAVVNGTCPDDWAQVAALAAREPLVRPAYGVHPWRLGVAPDGWLDVLRARLLAEPAASIGEIGLDRGEHASAPVPAQVAALHAQLAPPSSSAARPRSTASAPGARCSTRSTPRPRSPPACSCTASPAPPRSPASSRAAARCSASAPRSSAAHPPRSSATSRGDRIVVETDAPRAAPSALPGTYAALAELRTSRSPSSSTRWMRPCAASSGSAGAASSRRTASAAAASPIAPVPNAAVPKPLAQSRASEAPGSGTGRQVPSCHSVGGRLERDDAGHAHPRRTARAAAPVAVPAAELPSASGAGARRPRRARGRSCVPASGRAARRRRRP